MSVLGSPQTVSLGTGTLWQSNMTNWKLLHSVQFDEFSMIPKKKLPLNSLQGSSLLGSSQLAMFDDTWTHPLLNWHRYGKPPFFNICSNQTSPWVFQIYVSLPVYPNPDPRWSKCLLLFALIPITVGFHPGAAQQLHAIRVLRAGVDQGATDVVEDLGRPGEFRVCAWFNR